MSPSTNSSDHGESSLWSTGISGSVDRTGQGLAVKVGVGAASAPRAFDVAAGPAIGRLPDVGAAVSMLQVAEMCVNGGMADAVEPFL